jgi:HD superfamily phosphohydrolase
MRKSQPGKLLPLEQTSTLSAFGTHEKRKRRNPKAESQELFLPVSGFVWFFLEEIEVINHPAFQRLGRINQLGQAYLVFRGATHKRFEHSLGAVHVVQRMLTAVSRNSDKALNRGYPLGTPLTEQEERFVRLGVLLHDIGHLAAGHTLEDELGLISPHDGDDRLNTVFNKRDFDHERPGSLGALIDALYETYVPAGLKGRISPTNIVRMLIRKPPKKRGTENYDKDSDKFADAYELLSQSSEIRLNICSNMVGNTICADLLDYLFRDWYHVGKPRTFDDRILQYMEIRSTEPTRVQEIEDNAPPSPNDKFVVCIRAKPEDSHGWRFSNPGASRMAIPTC